MLQRATHALATKKSADDKHPKSRSREASSTLDGDEKYGHEKVSKKDLKAREKEAKLEENSKFSSNLPLSGLFSRKTLLLHPLPHLPAALMSHQTPPGPDKSVDKNAQRLKDSEVSIEHSISSSTPSTPSKGNCSRITSRESSDADMNIPGDDQTHGSSLHGSSSLSHSAPQNMPFSNLEAFCTPKPHSSSGRSILIPPNSKPEENKSLKESSPAISSLSEVASSHKLSPSESETIQGNRHKSAKGNLFSSFRFWFNEDRRKRKQNVAMLANYSHVGTSRSGGRVVSSPGAVSPPSVASNVDADLRIRKSPGDSQTPRSGVVHRRPSKGSRRSSMQSNRQVSLELRNNSASKRRSDSSRASFGSITGTRTPASEPSSHISGSQSTINPSRGSSDGHGRSRRPETHGRRTSMSSAGSRRSTAPLQHLAPNQLSGINPVFVRRTSSTGTTVRRVTAPVISTSSSNRPRPPKAPSFTSSVRTSISSEEGIPMLNRRASGGPDDHRIHSPIAVHDVEETIEEEDDGGEEEEKESAEGTRTDRQIRIKTDDARRSAFEKLSGDKTVKNQSQSSFEGGSINQSGAATRTIFMAHKPHSVFGTPTQAFFARTTQSPIATKFNVTSSTTGNVTSSYSNLMKSIADGPSTRKSSAEPKLRDVFANKAKEEGEWVDVDEEDDECARYEGGIGQGVKSRTGGGVGGTNNNKDGPTTAPGGFGKLDFNNNSSSSIKKNTPGPPSSSLKDSPPTSSNLPVGLGNSPAASLIGNWRGGHPRVTSNFKSIAIEEEDEED